MASPATNLTRYNVFLGFRGEDTRNSITGHIYEALVRSALATFKDDREIDPGKELEPEIVSAIKESEASVIVFSKNFATSSWCLDELSLILEQRNEGNHFVLPVFYHVDPSDVRNQTGTFKIEVKDSKRWTDDNVKRWKIALTKAANLTGLVLSGSEAQFVKNIVDIIYSKLARKRFRLPLNLVRMDSRYQEINSWIKQHDAKFLVICGMGGSGKTTLARYIAYSNSDNFENISIIEHIGRIWKEPQHLLELQEKLLEGLLGDKKKEIVNISKGECMIGEALEKNKALIVLDDIADLQQLVHLLGTGNMNKETKIIVTTRKTNISEWFDSRSWRCLEHNMKLLDDDESLELLSLHAFGSKTPLESYKELAKQVLRYCEGNPLALEVLGSSLSEDISIQFWKSSLNLLKTDIHSGIDRVLRRSYDSLPYRSEQELFLHIACFFNGADMDYVIKIFEKDCSAVSSIKTLTKRCLLSISPDQTIVMHPLLQEMGRFIVLQESPDDPAERSRVWQNVESYDLLINGTGSKKVKGLALDKQMLTEENNAFQESDLKTDSLKSMCNLKLLSLKSVQLTGPYEHFSKGLRWLCWNGFNLRSIPSDLYMGNLVALDMSASCLKVFKLSMVLQSLKILNLQNSLNLFEIHNIEMIPNLETLILWNCHNLVYVCETIEGLKSLALLNMTGCENLFKNPQKSLKTLSFDRGSTYNSFFSMPHSLERLFLKECKLEHPDHSPLNFSDQLSIQYLNLVSNPFEFVPNVHFLRYLQVLDLSLCSRLKELLDLPGSLAELYISHCESLEKVTFKSHRFTLQKLVYEGCTNLSEIEGFIKLVPVAKHEESDLGHMKWLKEHQYREVQLVGIDELTKSGSQCVQVLYEFGIMSTSLPCIKYPNMTPEHILEKTSTSLSFKVPEIPQNKRLRGINVTFKYTIAGDDLVWFAKISTTIGVDLIYNPTIFGRPAIGDVGIWLSYWPIGNTLCVKDEINVSIVVISGLEVCECGASLVYADDQVTYETFKHNMGWVETLGGDMSAFQLSNKANYLCRRDFLNKLEVDEPPPRWFRNLVGGNIDHAEVRGWGKTGQPKQSNSSITQLKTVNRVIQGPEVETRTPAPILHHHKPPSISVASGSSRSIMDSSGTNAFSYDVFLSFRGEDTRHSFTDHLYDALVRAGFLTIKIDSMGLESILEIERLIKASKASIVVWSENYARSTRCLDELSLILKHRKECGHLVLPVYYHVDPSDVRKQNKTFELEAKTSTMWTHDNVNRWKKSLTGVVKLIDMVLFGGEADFIKEIVNVVFTMLNRRELYLPPYLKGMDSQIRQINSWFEQSDANFLIICGMAGSGKTTLARYIINSHQGNFENSSFLEDIGSRCKEPGGLLQQIETLLRDILGDRNKKIPSIYGIKTILEEALESKKTLIVLDDIVDKGQLEAFFGRGKINELSKIIITTRDASIERWFGSRSWTFQEYKMKLLNDGDSSELLSLHAFGSKTPMEGYEEVAKKVLQYCEGNPLALAVLGSSLSGGVIELWKSALALLEKDMHPNIFRAFMKSYKSLPYDFEKELFLDIACFFTGEDMDFVVKILDGMGNSIVSAIKILTDRHLVSVSPNKKLMMHRLHQDFARNIVDQESLIPFKRSRVWRDRESYKVLRKKNGSQSMHGLALNMERLRLENESIAFQSSNLMTEALKRMENLKFLQLKFVHLTGSYENFPRHLRLLCWHGFHLRAIPSELYMGNMVVIDMSYSKLEVFEPPMILQSMRILNLKDSHNLQEVRNISRLPNLETLILSCCHILVHLCETLGFLTNLTLLDITKCEKLFKGTQSGLFARLTALTFVQSTKKPSFFLPHSLERLCVKACNIESFDSFQLSLSDRLSLQYLNLGNNLFELLPNYNHLASLRVLDLTSCSRLKCLLSLLSTLAELYVNHCESLEKVTFESHQFTLQKFECEGCSNLSEIEGIIKLEPVTKLDESNMKWLKEYQNHEVCLIGNKELTIGRRSCVQILYEFDIMSISLPDIKDPNMTHYILESSSLCFEVPRYPKNRRLKGLNVTFKYTISGDALVWFAKVNTTNGVDLMYSPTVFGKPESGEVGMWFSYWPIGNKLAIGDEVYVSIIVMSGLEVIECGASLVYTYHASDEKLENKTGWGETLGEDFSRFQLSTGAYYLCRSDFYNPMEAGRLSPDRFRILVGDAVDYTEVQGWKINGRPKQANPRFTELN